MNIETETQTEVRTVADVVTARQRGRSLALELGFDAPDVTLIAAAISEVARNIVDHAKQGEIVISGVHESGGKKKGIQIVARDEGPGIADVMRAMHHGYDARQGVGIGLSGAKRLMDEFDLESEVGRGTTITMKKWRR